MLIELRSRRLVAAVLAGVVIATTGSLAGLTAGQAVAEPAPPAAASSDPELAAKQEAIATGEPVVVDALTSEFELVTARPDGTFTAEVSAK